MAKLRNPPPNPDTCHRASPGGRPTAQHDLKSGIPKVSAQGDLGTTTHIVTNYNLMPLMFMLMSRTIWITTRFHQSILVGSFCSPYVQVTLTKAAELQKQAASDKGPSK